MTRETAIKGLKAFRKEFSGYEPNEEMFDMAIKALEQEPRKGKWINTANPRMSDNIVCSECGYNSIADYRYCPCCGAKMESEDNNVGTI